VIGAVVDILDKLRAAKAAADVALTADYAQILLEDALDMAIAEIERLRNLFGDEEGLRQGDNG
jgi:hypothetical protein